MTWQAYTEAVTRLSAVRGADRDQIATATTENQQLTRQVSKLDTRMRAQAEQLTKLAAALKLPAPRLSGVVRSPVTDPAEALRLAAAAAQRAEAGARLAEQRAGQPMLLPGMSAGLRNALVYLTAATVGTIVSVLIFALSPGTEFGQVPLRLAPWSLCGLPALAFFGGYLTIALIGQPKLGEAGTRSPKLGGAICFVGMPILWFLFIAASR